MSKHAYKSAIDLQVGDVFHHFNGTGYDAIRVKGNKKETKDSRSILTFQDNRKVRIVLANLHRVEVVSS